MEFNINLPYCSTYGKISQETFNDLLELNAGKISNFTLYNIYNYAYQLSIGQLRQSFLKMAEVKKLHYDKICEAIVNFGGLPLISGKTEFWSGKYMIYYSGSSSIIEIENIENKIILQQESIIEKTENQSLKKLLSRLIIDEQIILNGLKSKR